MAENTVNMTSEGRDQSDLADPATRERLLAAREAGGGKGHILSQSLQREHSPADSVPTAQ